MARRSMKPIKTIAFVLIGLVLAWQFLRLPEVIEAILTFFLAGVVPGTHIVLSPDAVIRLSVSTAVIVILLAFLRPYVRRLLGHTKEAAPDAIGPVEELDMMSEAAPVNATVTPAEAFRQQMYLTAATTAAETTQPATRSGVLLQRGIDSTAAALDRVMPKLFVAAAKTSIWLRPRIMRARQATVQAYRYARRYTIMGYKQADHELRAFWRWLLPYLKRFDRWLEIQVRHTERWIQRKLRDYKK